MALRKAKEIYNFGITGDYHKIIETNINWLKKQLHVVVATFLSEEARRNGKDPVSAIGTDFYAEEFPLELEALKNSNGDIIKLLYKKIKKSKLNEKGEETNFFADAEDC